MSTVRLIGLVVAFVAGLLLSRSGSMWATAPVVAVTVLIAVLVSELSRPRPERQRGSGAALEVRRVRDYVRRGAALGGLGLGLLFLAELWVLGQFANSTYVLREYWNDSMVGFSYWTGTSRMIGGASATAVVTVAVLLLCPAVVWWAVRTPRAGADDTTRERDERWRRGVVQTCVAAGGWVLSVLVLLWNVTFVILSPPFEQWANSNDWVVASAALLTATGLGGVAVYGAVLLPTPDR